MKEYLYFVAFSWQTQNGCQVANDFIPYNKRDIKTKEDVQEFQKHLREIKEKYPDSPVYSLVNFFRLKG